jgi:hypothetical protein
LIPQYQAKRGLLFSLHIRKDSQQLQVHDPQILADMSDRTEEILIGVMTDLRLPKDPRQHDRSLRSSSANLFGKLHITAGTILRSLNSAGHSELETLVWEHLGKESGSSLERRKARLRSLHDQTTYSLLMQQLFPVGLDPGEMGWRAERKLPAFSLADHADLENLVPRSN